MATRRPRARSHQLGYSPRLFMQEVFDKGRVTGASELAQYMNAVLDLERDGGGRGIIYDKREATHHIRFTVGEGGRVGGRGRVGGASAATRRASSFQTSRTSAVRILPALFVLPDNR